MDLSKLSDQQLMANTKALVKEESCILAKILHHIKEIDRRRLYADYKQPGLLELVMSELKYPRDQAIRRIKAMRMMRDNPIVAEKIENGEMNLTTIAIVQVLFSHEKKEGKPLTLEEKNAVIEKVSGKSTREAQKIVLSLSSSPVKFNDKITMIGVDLYELTTVIDEETNQILMKLKGLLAHSHPNISIGELIKIIAKIGLKEMEQTKAALKKSQRVKFESSEIETDGLQEQSRVNLVAAPPPTSKAEVKRQIWKRDNHKCTNCGSTFALEEDHRTPKAKGGQYTLENMRLLCRSCNQRAAIKHFGAGKMENFLS